MAHYDDHEIDRLLDYCPLQKASGHGLHQGGSEQSDRRKNKQILYGVKIRCQKVQSILKGKTLI
jgi:hypothetical protein